MDFNSWQWGNWEEEIVLLRDENNANRDRLQGLAPHGGDGDGNDASSPTVPISPPPPKGKAPRCANWTVEPSTSCDGKRIVETEEQEQRDAKTEPDHVCKPPDDG